MLSFPSLSLPVRLMAAVVLSQSLLVAQAWSDGLSDNAQRQYTTVAGDTLSEIAMRFKPDGGNLISLVDQIFNDNPDAFVDNNPNLLKVDVELSITTAASVVAEPSIAEKNTTKLEAPQADPVITPSIPQSIAARPEPQSTAPASAEEVKVAVYNRLRSARPELKFSDFEASPMPGVYQIKINGQLAFVSADGNHLIAGEMYEVQDSGMVNLQELERQKAEVAFQPQRAKMMQAVSVDDMVVYSPESGSKGYVYVFTDIDCGFCRKLHSQMSAYLAKGIEVRYLAFPRAGVNSKSAQKLATTWCSDNPQKMMTAFKSGRDVQLASCENNPIADQYMLGQQIGVTGTPAIILESGRLIPGAVSPDYLAKEMGI